VPELSSSQQITVQHKSGIDVDIVSYLQFADISQNNFRVIH